MQAKGTRQLSQLDYLSGMLVGQHAVGLLLGGHGVAKAEQGTSIQITPDAKINTSVVKNHGIWLVVRASSNSSGTSPPPSEFCPGLLKLVFLYFKLRDQEQTALIYARPSIQLCV